MKRIALLLTVVVSACVPMMSAQEIQEANQRHYARMCADPNYAYETGYNNGLKRKNLDTTWVDYNCAPDARVAVRQSYQTGYQSGMEHAPVVVRGSGFGGGRYVYSSAETCTFNSDCGEDRSCRPDASGTKVCMGGGFAGDACWFGSDCVSGSCDIGAKTCR